MTKQAWPRPPARRISMLTPSSNTVLEPTTSALIQRLSGSVTVHYARFPVTVISDAPESHRQFQVDHMLAAARLLVDARVDAIVWNGTSGAWEGLDGDRLLVDRIRAETGIPATTVTLALIEVMRSAGIRRYALVVPYVDAIARRIVGTLGSEGFTCVGLANEGISTNFEFAEMPADVIAARVRDVAAEAEAVVIHCTNLRGAEVATALEIELHRPVLDSVVVALHGGLELLGVSTDLPGFSALARANRAGRG